MSENNEQMMQLVTVNNVSFPNPDKGTVSVDLKDEYNSYTTEDGGEVVESIRTDKIFANVAYKGLTAEDIATLEAAITLVSTVVLYNPHTNASKTITAKITNRKSKIIAYYNNVSLWSLSFDMTEL